MKFIIAILLPLLPLVIFSQTLTDSVIIQGTSIRYVVNYTSTVYADGDSISFRSSSTKRRGLISPLALPISALTQTALDAKQATLVSATNIKTVNGNTLLGSGDISISSAVAWGGVTGTLSNQTDLNNALAAKQASGSYAVTTNNLSDLSNAATARTNLSLGNVDNTSDANKPVSTEQQTALDLKANIASPAFTGTPTGIGIPVYAQVTGSNVTTTGQALVNITGLSVALTTNAVYEFEAVMSVSTSAVTTGTAYGVNYSVAGGAVEAQITGSSTATATKTLRISALNTATALYLAGSAQTGGVVIKGRVTTGANAGNFTISHLKLTSGTSTVFIGSFLKVTRIS